MRPVACSKIALLTALIFCVSQWPGAASDPIDIDALIEPDAPPPASLSVTNEVSDFEKQYRLAEEEKKRQRRAWEARLLQIETSVIHRVSALLAEKETVPLSGGMSPEIMSAVRPKK